MSDNDNNLKPSDVVNANQKYMNKYPIMLMLNI